MLPHLLAAVGLALVCGAWALLQRWIVQHAPDVRGPEGGCKGCHGCDVADECAERRR